MSPAPFAIALDLAGRRALVAGAGRVGGRRAARLVAAGARVTVVSPEAGPAVRELAGRDALTWYARPAVPADLDGVSLAVLATDDPATQAELAAAAAARGILAGRADVPGGGDFQVLAEAARGDLRVTVSTGGRSPRLARHLRALFGEELEGWLPALGVLEDLRSDLKARGLSAPARAAFWRRFPDAAAWRALRAGEEIGREVERCLSSPSA